MLVLKIKFLTEVKKISKKLKNMMSIYIVIILLHSINNIKLVKENIQSYSKIVTLPSSYISNASFNSTQLLLITIFLVHNYLRSYMPLSDKQKNLADKQKLKKIFFK